ncbi:hypothetical protein [Tissierella praeacuta]|uniref:hypothetical protein n=1 Tax=Tissierella praeacuta TaxID=43131 RepID=UPI00333E6A66
MNKIKFSYVFLIILAISILVFNAEYIMPNNKYLSEIKSQFNSLLYKYDNFEDELPVVNHTNENLTCKDVSLINKYEAVEDTEYLFSLLKFGYAGYEFFGGDDIFIPAKKNIIWSVVASSGEDIEVNKFLNIIYSELKFIQDSHFSIGNYKLCNYTKYFSNEKFILHKDDNGYYTKISSKPFYLKKVNNEEP